MSNNPNVSTASATSNSIGAGISREFHDFIADIEDLVKQTTALTGDDLVRAKAKLSARVAAAKDSVEALGDDVAHRARKVAADTNTYVHEQPWKAIGAGAVIGLLLGAVLARRN
ncbi:MAG: hypothetical protein Q8L45_11275 [Xanthomonadaceae bacterium]|nr:hypothetical protein [Xanthomonadaceae bacterium]MDP2186285.1 hypothetical protein [Xanthomonadales bacterium]MDZ4115324.1 hypothetical protein [Xanthomonadaceae bacterium]MDZ4377058.1 hypothetical protein [Xanthomonadaceae bacterium]